MLFGIGEGMYIFYETLAVPKFNVLSRENIILVLSAQLAIIISLEPAFSLLSVEKSLLESAASKKQVLCFVFASKVGSKEPA